MISKVNETSKNKESEQNSNEEATRRLEEKFQIVAQEIEISKALASNDQYVRGRQIKKLKKWLQIRAGSSYPFFDDDFLPIWKGLFYSMWMCDKPINQEQLADELGSLIYCFNSVETGIMFFKSFLRLMVLEWGGIDQWRIDKFLMLVRRMFRHMFFALKKHSRWDRAMLSYFNNSLNSTVLLQGAPEGLAMHVADIFLEELAKTSDSDIPTTAVTILIQPFLTYMSRLNEPKQLGYVRNRIFFHLLWQSKKGREFSEKFEAWKEMGFPSKSIDDLEKIEDPSEKEKGTKNKNNSKDNPLDPRAGNVDVYMPEIPVDVGPIIDSMERMLYKNTNTRSRKYLRKLIITYKIFQQGYFPLGIKNINKPNVTPMQLLIEEKIEDLYNLDDELCSTSRKIKTLSKKARRRLLKSINFEDLNEENFEEAIDKAITTINKRNKSMKDLENDWVEEDILSTSGTNDMETEETPECTSENENDNSKAKEKSKSKSFGKIENTGVSISGDIKRTKIYEKEKVEEDEEIPLLVPIYKIQEDSNDDSMSKRKKTSEEGNLEYVVPTKKLKLKETNSKLEEGNNKTESVKIKKKKTNLLLNPFSIKALSSPKTPQNSKLLGKNKKKLLNQQIQKSFSAPKEKKVKIVLTKNTAQNPSDYIQQVISSPQLPYDPKNKPTKSLLKPALFPSPINPFYKIRNGINDTF